MAEMERMWRADAKKKYPMQWIVMVNLTTESSNKTIGDIYLVTPNKKEAYDTAKALGDTMGKKMVIEGFNDTPQIGGLYLCTQ